LNQSALRLCKARRPLSYRPAPLDTRPRNASPRISRSSARRRERNRQPDQARNPDRAIALSDPSPQRFTLEFRLLIVLHPFLNGDGQYCSPWRDMPVVTRGLQNAQCRPRLKRKLLRLPRVFGAHRNPQPDSSTNQPGHSLMDAS